uniref:Uncharacterized protein n=2 Tax=Schistocephalus solidus TaxID=70667 RepID=A0A0X3PDI3_SCHSO
MNLVHIDTQINSSHLTDKSTRSYPKEPGRSRYARNSAQNLKSKSRLAMAKSKSAIASGGCKLTDLCPEDRERLADLVSHLSDVQSALETAHQQQQQWLQWSSDHTAVESKTMPPGATCPSPGLDFLQPSPTHNTPAQSLRLQDPLVFEGPQLTCQQTASSLPLFTSSFEAERCVFRPPIAHLNLPGSSYRSMVGVPAVPPSVAGDTAVTCQQWSNDPAHCPSNNHGGIRDRLPYPTSRAYATPAQYERQLLLLETDLQNLRASLGGWTSGPSKPVMPNDCVPRSTDATNADLNDALYKHSGTPYAWKQIFCASGSTSRSDGPRPNPTDSAGLQAESDKVSLKAGLPKPVDPTSNLQVEATADVVLSEKPFAAMDDKPERLNVAGRTCAMPVWEVLSDEKVESGISRDSYKPKHVLTEPVVTTPAPLASKMPKVLIDEGVQMGEQKSSSDNAVQTDLTGLASCQRNSNAVTEDTAAPETLETQSSAYVSAATPSTTAQSPSIPVPLGTASSEFSAGRSLSPRPSDNVELKRLAAQPTTQRFSVHSPTSAFVAVSAKPRRLHLLCRRNSNKERCNLRFRRQAQPDSGERPEVTITQTKKHARTFSTELEEGLYLSQLLNNCKHTENGLPSSNQALGGMGSLLSAEEEELFNELFFVN